MSRVNLFTGADAVKYIMNHAEVSAVFCTQDKLQNVSSSSCIFYFVAFLACFWSQKLMCLILQLWS